MLVLGSTSVREVEVAEGRSVGDEGIPGLAEKLNRLFLTVPAVTRTGLYSNDSAAAALAERGVTVTGTHLSHLRTGRRDNPSARLLAGLADLFGLPIDYFFDPTMAEKVNAELEALSALRDSEARSLMLLAQGSARRACDTSRESSNTSAPSTVSTTMAKARIRFTQAVQLRHLRRRTCGAWSARSQPSGDSPVRP